MKYISSNEHLTRFDITMRFLAVFCCREKPDKEKVGAGIESLLLRGCTVRNTDSTFGFVVYAGTSSIFSASSLLICRVPLQGVPMPVSQLCVPCHRRGNKQNTPKLLKLQLYFICVSSISSWMLV